jgi:membrane-associated phospholipid phosphatase
MNIHCLRNPYAQTAVYLVLVLLIGILVSILPLNGAECNIVSSLQNFAQKTTGLQTFQVLTYLGDFYFWVVLASVYFFYAYFKSRKRFDSASELAIFLVITTALTYSVKMIFARPRPNCPNIKVYDEDLFSSSSYPSGHVSRATGGYVVLSRGNRTKQSLAVAATCLVSLSRIVLGAHYLTDVIGGVFLSIAAQRLANFSLPYLTRLTANWHNHLSKIATAREKVR